MYRFMGINNKKAKRESAIMVQTPKREVCVSVMSNGAFVVDITKDNHQSLCLSKESAEYLLYLLFGLQKEYLRDIISTKTRIDCKEDIKFGYLPDSCFTDNEKEIDKILSESESPSEKESK